METLAVDDIVKLASVSSKFRSLLAEATKTAAEGPTDFNETVPVNEGGEEDKEKGNPPAKPPEKKEEVAAEPIAPPVPPPVEAAGTTPEVAGANAARAFVGEDTMAAAATGDPSAQDMVARVAGQVAAGVAEAVARKTAQPEAVPPGVEPPIDGAVPPVPPTDGAPAGVNAVPAAPVASPEEAVANDIAPAPAPAPAPTPAAPPQQVGVQLDDKGQQTTVAPQANAAPVAAGPNAGQPVDPATVAKLIELAKAGKI